MVNNDKNDKTKDKYQEKSLQKYQEIPKKKG